MNYREWQNRNDSLKKDGLLFGNMHTAIVQNQKFIDAFGKLYKNVSNPPSNSYIELTNYRKLVPVILQYVESLAADNDRYVKMLNRFADDSKEKSHKRWTEQEDNLLIEMVCKDESMPILSAALGRTVPAIKTRLTYLVGVKRLSQKVVGKFIGEINGEQTEASLAGTIYKE